MQCIKTIVFVVNVDWFFVSHRLPLAEEALSRGWRVFLIAKDTGKFGQLERLGLKCIPLHIDRSSKNFLKEFLLIRALKNIYNKIQPDIVHHVTLKPCIYGTIALRNFKGVKIINAISGLGYSFTDNRNSWSKSILVRLLKFAFKRKSSKFIFQNPDDLAFYAHLKFVTTDNSTIIKGSGVDENVFNYTQPESKAKVIVTLLCRMLKDKGVQEFIEAAKLLKKGSQNQLQFMLVGGIDVENPAHITKNELESMCDGEYLSWKGSSSDVMSVYSQSDIVCLPSYREGLPKSLVEAMAIGRPVITTDAVGCRECVDHGVNGFLVPVKDHIKLSEKILLLASDEQLRIKMGKKSREKMVNEMCLSLVVRQTFEFYEK
ncbi:glycosyltransferase family 4 protein [Pedobacter sp. JCM 36344]|uniref:glycosyltransferase family 4 protein n=1 Tax=Pedobacter sp. JCM 36344 TaxID=3374280 RepID=UPI00397BDFBF